MKALDAYGTGLADQYGQQYESNLAGVAGTGQAAASGLAGVGANYAGAVSSNNNSAASATGNAALANAATTNALITNAIKGFGAVGGQSSFGGVSANAFGGANGILPGG